MGNLRDADGRGRWGKSGSRDRGEEIGRGGRQIGIRGWRGEGKLGVGGGREGGLWRHYQPERRRQRRPVAAAAAAAGVGNHLNNAG